MVGHFIKNQDTRLADKCAGNREALHFSSREGLSPQSNMRVDSVGQSFDHLVQPALRCRLGYVLICERGISQCDVVAHCAGDEETVLENDADASPECRVVKRLHPLSVHENFTGLRFEDGCRQLEDGCFAGSVGADERDDVAGAESGGEVLDDGAGV